MKIVKEKAFRFYKKWRGQKTYCPALKSNVVISLKAWKHITGASGNTKRKISDVYRRLKLLPYAKEIIEKSTTIQGKRKRKSSTFYVLEAMVDIKEKNGVVTRKVRVIILEDKSKKKTFLSVMDKKNRKKRRPRRAF